MRHEEEKQMPNKAKVADYMARDLHTLSPGTDIPLAVDVLFKHTISGTPMVDGEGQLLGVIS